MNIVLISTYELGRQPFGLASPAAWLRKGGHTVSSLDLSRQPLDEAAVREAALVAVYLPMHTATRLGAQLVPTLRRLNPRAHLCCYGLYAPTNAEFLRTLGVCTILGGEFEEGLAHLADRLRRNGSGNGCGASSVPQSEPLISLARQRFIPPDRQGLAALASYAHVVLPSGEHRLAGYTEASRGCKHLCRHCPIVSVYQGMFRVVDREVVLADVRQQVVAGAQHITFGDPDFFNGSGHATAIVSFTAWTTLDSYLELLRVLRENDLVENVAPIQLAIRLLIPRGSRLLELDEIRHLAGPFDPSALVYPWSNADARVDALGAEMEQIVSGGEKHKLPRQAIFERIWKAAHEAAGVETELAARPVLVSRPAIPYLNEPWYC